MDLFTMDYPLTMTAILRRCETLFGGRTIVSERPDRSVHRSTYRDLLQRARKLAVALQALGVRPGDRVATLCWNHHQHLEAYFGITGSGAVLHTLNLRLHPSDLAYIVNHAEDKVMIVDDVLLPLLEQFRAQVHCAHVIVISSSGKVPAGMHDYEQLVAGTNADPYSWPELDEQQPAAMCYTSGTTGQPKGVMYTHRAITLHSLILGLADTLGMHEADVVFPMVPLFHANGWGVPFAAALFGARQVLSGPHYDPPRILQLLQDERVTLSAGVPVIWLGVLQHLDRHPGQYDLSSVRGIMVGGSAAPRSLIQGLQERHGLKIIQIWGMTEMAPIGTVCRLPGELSAANSEEQYDYRMRQGTPAPLIEIRARGVNGVVPWDGQAAGELEVRGPWVAGSYYNCPEGASSFTADAWFRTGDMVTIDPRGCITIQDRIKDVIKSGGEWISSVALENALMGHPAVAEAAVIGVAHPKWDERPLAVVVFKEGQSATEEELLRHLAPNFAKWWLPDALVFVKEIPRTSAGKFLKMELRKRFQDYLGTRTVTADRASG